MYNNWNHHKYLYVKNFIPIEDLNVILKDIEYYFTSNLHKEEKGSVIKSGQQTKPNLHIIGKSKPWKNYYKKLSELASALGKDDSITCVFYVQNPDISLGTHLQENNTDIIIPGHENSLLIFDGTIVHDAIFPTHKLTKPRYSLITDYE